MFNTFVEEPLLHIGGTMPIKETQPEPSYELYPLSHLVKKPFIYVPSAHTDIRATIARYRALNKSAIVLLPTTNKKA